MTRSLLARGLAGLLIGAGLAQARASAQDQPPPLEPPALVPPRTTTTTPKSTKPQASSSRNTPARPAENHSLLVIPGVTAPLPPRSSPRLVSPAGSPAPAASTTTSPTRTQGSTKPARTVQRPARPAPSPPSSIPLTLEAIPDDPPAELGSERPPADRPAPSRSARPTSPQPMENVPGQTTPRPSPLRSSSSVLGRLLGPSSPNEDLAPPRSSIAAEPHSDPAAEAALKRRIQKQVEHMLGDHVRSIEVRVTGRTVVFRAHASRFWYRRSVRRTLETLPLPAGYRARVEAVE